ncbi:MAG: F0F1 ATP synthase subunit A [Firmicutes bacterium]|nr:F0F1 ATP synthase subunit A [Bacillota bacterium]
MKKTKRKHQKLKFALVWLALIGILIAAICAIGLPAGEKEDIKEVMKDAVLHETNRVPLFGLAVNPAVYSAFIVTGVLLIVALLIRYLAMPKFTRVPGRFQAGLEAVFDLFDSMARKNSPHKTNFVSAYIFCAGVYIFFSTLFELFGIQALTTAGRSISLPAPLADINGALAMGILSFGVILGAGFVVNGPLGGLKALKDFSLPISMSFRLFGALLSGLLVTELVYHYTVLSFVLPVFVAVVFTLLHAVIQAYVLTTLVSIFYGEAVEPRKKKKPREELESPEAG